jgi:hypothetical protein
LKLTPDVVAGSWIGFGVGINKQYFIVKKVGNKLRGMVCGRCDNPYTMAALDDFVIDGEVHALQHPPRRLGRLFHSLRQTRRGPRLEQ